MPTLRRYCRVSKYTVLECRIYLDNPADLTTWLLSPRYNILPRIFASIKPLVLPKLQEEQLRTKTKGKKAAAVKDVVVEDDFEVSLFLTNSGTRHTVITKRKTFRAAPQKLLSNSSRLTGGDRAESVQLEILRESTEDDHSPRLSLNDIPAAPTPTIVVPDNDADPEPTPRRSARTKSQKRKSPAPPASDGGAGSDLDSDTSAPRPPKRRKTPTITILDEDGADGLFADEAEQGDDDKKKMALDTEYEGFNIYSHILCVVVKRRGNVGRKTPATEAKGAAAGRVMEEWITMSQAIKEGDLGGELE